MNYKALVVTLLTISCGEATKGKTFSGTNGALPAGEAEIWVTKADYTKLLHREKNIVLENGHNGAERVITLGGPNTYQIMDGFGASWTDASAWLFNYQLSEWKKEEVMESLFGKTGIKLSFLRQPMGATDYSWAAYSYADEPNDWDLSSFSVDRDKPYIIPTVQRSLAKNPDIKVMASPWSPPGWMKSSGRMVGGGYLKPECYQVYSEYFVRFVKEYEKLGIPIYAVTMQNEPNYEPAHYPGMRMTPNDQVGFLNNDLGPAFQRNGFKTKIIAFDHNFDDEGFPASVLDRAYNYAAGSAWHPYTTNGNHRAMGRIHDRFPKKGIWFTEASGGSWHGGASGSFRDIMANTIRAPRNWARSVIYWNIALDQNSQPSMIGSASVSTGLVTIRSNQKDSVSYNLEYYALGHSSKFLDKGARRIGSNDFFEDVENVAYRNVDGSVVVVLFNRSWQKRTVALQFEGKTVRYTIDPDAAATIKWYPK